ncbi:MAG: hypothetical protein HY043_01920 [Verrucomicrobia bacterium]|nr:hypothetical protein [Verrucomicrobiota bacterium]
MPPTSGFQATIAYRWLHSDRMFSHDVEQTQREVESSQEINDSNFIDLGITYAFNPRFSATLTIPFAVNDRSQVVRAFDVQRTILGRFHTGAAGLADLRLEGNAWLLNPATHMKGNVLLGVGFSAPTGDRDAQDTFLVPAFGSSTPVAQRHAVDQSIQLGNGGWGVVLDLYAYREIVPRLSAFLNGSYTITPEERYSPTASLFGDYSIADSYQGRGGFEYLLWPRYSLSFSLAGRIDGVPVNDLVGGSDGFRRPGYSVSIEPGVSLAYKEWSFSVNTPVALYRTREQSISEKAAGIDPIAAGFADFIVTCSVMKRF